MLSHWTRGAFGALLLLIRQVNSYCINTNLCSRIFPISYVFLLFLKSQYGITSTDWSKWLKIGFSLAQAGVAVFEAGLGNPLGLLSVGEYHMGV